MNKSDRVKMYGDMIDGLQTVVGSNGVVTVKGVVTKVSDCSAVLQTAVDAPAATTKANAAFRQAVAQERAANTAANAMYLGVKQWAAVQYGNQPTVMAQLLGTTLKEKKAPDVATKAKAADKSRQTRAVLGTKGKKQRKAAKAAAASTPTADTKTTKSS
ncbi:MAG TPA: hypothetical protein VMI75_38565 [Polyangiaceae bacterium]|nr:hypothetical protein [Polyangiaceae bacterium]